MTGGVSSPKVSDVWSGLSCLSTIFLPSEFSVITRSHNPDLPSAQKILPSELFFEMVLSGNMKNAELIIWRKFSVR